jgi:hypothetical protein
MGSRSKDILLLVLAVAALGIAIYTFRGRPAPAPQPATAVSSDRGERGTAKPATVPAEEPSGEQTGAAASGGERNPFAAPGAASTPVTVAPSTQPPGEPQGTPGTPEAGTTAAAGQQAAVRPEPSQTGLTLTGIVAGRPTLAVIRDNGQRHFVKVGDQIGDRYRVQAIKRQEVVLASEEGQVTLRMGGRQ